MRGALSAAGRPAVPRRRPRAVTRELALGLVALAFMAPGATRAHEDRTQVEQRVRLAARMVTDPSTLQRLASQGPSPARAHHDEGRLHQSMAEEALTRGDLATARREADEAMRLLALARRLAPDDSQRRAAARRRHEQAATTLQRLVDAWQARLGEGEPLDGDLFAAIGLLATAQHFAQEGRWDEGAHTLRLAEQHLLGGMARAFGGQEIDYTERALQPADAFRIELRQVQALHDLLPLALRELQPTPQAQALAESHADTGRRLRQQAQQLAQAGDPVAALALLRQARQHGQRALAATGLNGAGLDTGGQR